MFEDHSHKYTKDAWRDLADAANNEAMLNEAIK